MQSDHLSNLLQRYPRLEACKSDITEAFNLLRLCFGQQGKVLLAGNGGSASDCDHIAGELLKSFNIPGLVHLAESTHLSSEAQAHLQHALPAIPLANLTGIMSAFCNDCDPAWCFAQLVWGLGDKKDVLWALSTSGNSKNILHAIEVAKAKGMCVLGLSGHTGGKMKALCDVCICVPETVTYKVQELHLPIYHCLCLMLESYFFGH